MVTLLDLIRMVLTMTGIMLGGGLGHQYGIGYAILGAIAGGLVGYKIGMVPTIITIRKNQKRMAKLTVDELVDRLYNHLFVAPEQLTPNYLLMELRARGEDISEHITLVLDLLEDEWELKRAAGLGALLSAYPHLAKYVRGYRPFQSVELCREKAARLREVIESASAKNKGDQA